MQARPTGNSPRAFNAGEERKNLNICKLEELVWSTCGKEKEKSWTQVLCGCKLK